MRSVGHESGFVPESEQKTKYEILANKETRERLKERVLRFVKNVRERDVESLVFLDRSARPFAWMFREVWNGLNPQETMPEIKFVNIGTQTDVHQGVAKLVNTGDYYDSKRLEKRIQKQEDEDIWMTASEIPYDWQEKISKQTELGETLRSIFHNAFEKQNVLIVDEMGASGATQAAALGLFTMTFPEARSVESVSLFSARDGFEGDLRVIPWLQIPGMAGVLELPETVLQSANITKENVSIIERFFDEKIKECLQKALQYVRECLSEILFIKKELATGVAFEKIMVQKLNVEEIQGVLTFIQDIFNKFLEEQSVKSFDQQSYDKRKRELTQLFFRWMFVIRGSRLEKFQFVLEEPENMFNQIKVLERNKLKQTNLVRLQKDTRQLRKEIKQLGQELVQEQKQSSLKIAA